MTNFFMFLIIGLVSLYVIGDLACIKKNDLIALTLGIYLSIFLIIFNAIGLVKIAGFLLGILNTLLGISLLKKKWKSFRWFFIIDFCPLFFILILASSHSFYLLGALFIITDLYFFYSSSIFF